jgi:hypothetical protein
LEFLEEKDGEGGAFLVLGCDYKKNSGNIWGPDFKLRTMNDEVLKGYARKLVLDGAKACGLQYDPAPIRVQDAQIWRKVFLTSSFLLIVPVAVVFIPDEELDEILKLWSGRNDSPRWRMLYRVRLIIHYA